MEKQTLWLAIFPLNSTNHEQGCRNARNQLATGLIVSADSQSSATNLAKSLVENNLICCPECRVILNTFSHIVVKGKNRSM